jgi:hypothetical protein
MKEASGFAEGSCIMNNVLTDMKRCASFLKKRKARLVTGPQIDSDVVIAVYLIPAFSSNRKDRP